MVYATDVAGRQEDAVVQQRGPAKSAAFDAAGNPTKAAEGFARRYGLKPDELEVRQTEAGEYVFAEQRLEGKPTGEVLGAAIPTLLTQLSFPKFMRWGEGRYRFSRPIRWLVALLGSDVVPFEVEGVKSSHESWGHRFLPVQGTEGQQRVAVANAAEYWSAVQSANVMVDAEERVRRVVEQGDQLAEADGVRVVWDPELLHEVAYVVEYPTAFMGRFSEEYLALPRPVLVSAMRKHQRYFYLENPDGSLAPRFLAVRNGGEHGLNTVREGNERVLAFRFNDAVHHYTEDQKTNLPELRERLRRVVFMQKLGSVYDKSERLEGVVASLVDLLARADLGEKAVEAARLCKADLASHMVGELPELQGTIGKEYGLRGGLDPEVAAAIEEHYQPKAAGDALPATFLGRLLALADRIDLLVAAFSLGHIPTGSSDPFGLRRAAAGVTALLAELPAEISLRELIDRSLQSYAGQAYYEGASPRPAAEVSNDLLQFFRPRVEALLEEAGVRLDLREALLAAGFDRIPGIRTRAEFLVGKLGDPSWDMVVAMATRIRNILKPVDGQLVEGHTSKLEDPSELALASAFEREREALTTAVDGGDWEGAWRLWSGLVPVVDQFFVDVLVNVEDQELRAARQALLRNLDVLFVRLADFSKIAAL